METKGYKLRTPVLHNWSAGPDGTEWDPPELRNMRITGEVFGSEKFNSGDRMTTSAVRKFNLAEGTVKTQNSSYVLGYVSLHYYTEMVKRDEKKWKNRLEPYLSPKDRKSLE